MNGLNLLIVDDSKSSCQIIAEQLSELKMNIKSVYSGTDAIDTIEESVKNKNPFNIAIIDNHMPVIDGIMLAEKIKCNDKLKNLLLVFLNIFLSTRVRKCLGQYL